MPGEQPPAPADARDRTWTTSRRALLAAGGASLAGTAGCLGLLESGASAADQGPWTQKRGGQRNRSFAPDRSPGSDLESAFHWQHPDTADLPEHRSNLLYSAVVTDGDRLYCAVNGTGIPEGEDPIEVDEVVALDPDSRDVLWRADAGGYPGAGTTVPPAVAEGTVLTCENRPVARDASDGSELWSLDGPPSWIPPVIADGTVYLSTRDGLRALDLSDGEDAWSEPPAESWSASAPAVGDDAVYVSNQAELAAFDRESGEELWRSPHGAFQSVAVARGDPGLLGAPVVGSDAVFAAGSKRMLEQRDHGGLVAFERDGGDVRWQFDFASAFDRSIPREPEVEDGRVTVPPEPTGAFGSPALAGGTLYAFGYLVGTPKLLAVDAASGELQWDVDLEGFTNHVLVGGDVVFAAVDGAVETYDRSDGTHLDTVTPENLFPHGNLGIATPTDGELLVPSPTGIVGFDG